MVVKIGVIGCGKWGRNHARVYSELDCELVALSDLNSEVKELAKKFGARFFLDYREMLPLVDAVSVVVSTDMHYDVVKACLEAGKHVLAEKPITLNSKRAKELLDIAKEKGLILTVGYLFRFNASVLELKKRLQDVGTIQYITARYMHSSKPPRKDCGVIFNLAAHLIDILTFLLDKKPQKVYCKKGNFLSEEREDMAIIILNYGGFITELEVSWLHPLKKRDMWIIGSKQKVYSDFLGQMMTVYPLEVSYDGIKADKQFNVEIRKNEPLKAELKQFCKDVGNGKAMNAHDEHVITKICELCLQSAEKEKELDVA